MVSIEIVNEDRAAVHTPLDDMKRAAGEFQAGAAWHATSMLLSARPHSKASGSTLVGGSPSRVLIASVPFFC